MAQKYFKISESLAFEIVDLILGEGFINSKHRYHINASVASMLLAQALELGTVEDTVLVMRCIDEE